MVFAATQFVTNLIFITQQIEKSHLAIKYIFYLFCSMHLAIGLMSSGILYKYVMVASYAKVVYANGVNVLVVRVHMGGMSQGLTCRPVDLAAMIKPRLIG